MNENEHRFLTGPLKWRLTDDYCHDGIPLANGLLGVLVWGSENVIRLTLNRADFWDHRGGMEWTEEATYTNMLRWIRAGDAASLYRAFEGGAALKRPTMLPMGRVELRFPDGYKVKHAALDIASGEARIEMEGASNSYSLKLCVLMEDPVLAVSIQGKKAGVPNCPEIKARPSYEVSTIVSKYFELNKIPAPKCFHDGELKGWIQELPEDEPACIACRDYPAAGGT
ncbi:MAG: glycoside hydrolase N-terminal domain-containing protein, partial [Kiritimatiellota bacterium]|nr:glycoside hydrolase N-terminal domain-containing protein [Kiritimatiellota bacterium]